MPSCTPGTLPCAAGHLEAPPYSGPLNWPTTPLPASCSTALRLFFLPLPYPQPCSLWLTLPPHLTAPGHPSPGMWLLPGHLVGVAPLV